MASACGNNTKNNAGRTGSLAHPCACWRPQMTQTLLLNCIGGRAAVLTYFPSVGNHKQRRPTRNPLAWPCTGSRPLSATLLLPQNRQRCCRSPCKGDHRLIREPCTGFRRTLADGSWLRYWCLAVRSLRLLLAATPWPPSWPGSCTIRRRAARAARAPASAAAAIGAALLFR